MVKKLPILILLSFISLATIAQPAALSCGNGRYITDVFPGVTKTTGITYGYNTVINYNNGTTYPRTLQFDFYEPTGDVAIKRPLVILAFGGAFISGQRSDMDAFCTALAKKGYAAVTIDYRLIYMSSPFDYSNISTAYSNPAYLADVIVKASADMKAAIRFLKANATASTYRIDTTKIFVGGYSAGAITALQTAYTDDVNENPTTPPSIYAANGDFEGNTSLAPNDTLLTMHNASGIAGVFNIAGGVPDTSLIDSYNPPVYSAQGNMDPTVPYDSGYVVFNTGFGNVTTAVYLYGTHTIQRRANTIGLSNQLYTIVNGNHTSPVRTDSIYFGQIVDGAAAFFQPIVCSAILPVSLTSFTVENSNCSASLKWQTASEAKSSRYEIEVSADGRQYMKVGTMASKNAANGASYNYTYKGFDGTAYYRLKMVDADGNYTYSPVQKLSLPCNLNTIQVYPNPAKDRTLITGLKAGMQVQLVNAQGQKLLLQKAGNSAMQVPLSTFTSGLYMIQVIDENGKVINNTKLMKE